VARPWPIGIYDRKFEISEKGDCAFGALIKPAGVQQIEKSGKEAGPLSCCGLTNTEPGAVATGSRQHHGQRREFESSWRFDLTRWRAADRKEWQRSGSIVLLWVDK
jgi:hypothetical protein